MPDEVRYVPETMRLDWDQEPPQYWAVFCLAMVLVVALVTIAKLSKTT